MVGIVILSLLAVVTDDVVFFWSSVGFSLLSVKLLLLLLVVLPKTDDSLDQDGRLDTAAATATAAVSYTHLTLPTKA